MKDEGPSTSYITIQNFMVKISIILILDQITKSQLILVTDTANLIFCNMYSD